MKTKSKENSKKILIIEDEQDIAKTMKRILETEGYTVEYTLDPKKGIEMVKKFDLLLLDIIMPIVSGREVLAEMARKKINTPVIVVSAIGFPREVETELKSKYPGLFVGFVSKPFMHIELVNEVKKNIGK